jgi:hypothetical protein
VQDVVGERFGVVHLAVSMMRVGLEKSGAAGESRASPFAPFISNPAAPRLTGLLGLLDRRIEQSNLLGRGGVDIADARLAVAARIGSISRVAPSAPVQRPVQGEKLRSSVGPKRRRRR